MSSSLASRALQSSRGMVARRTFTTRANNALHRPRVEVFNRNDYHLRKNMHVRALSFSSLGKAALRGLRLPVFAGTAALGTAAGTLAMANRTADQFTTFLSKSASDIASGVSSRFDALNQSSTEALEDLQNSSWYRNLSDFFSSKDSGNNGARDDYSGSSSGSSNGGGGGAGGSGGGGAAAAVLSTAFQGGQDDGNDETSSRTPTSTEELMMLTRKLIQVRNILKAVEHESESLSLPSIVVIGSQSSGKSSVLEAIVGHEFLPKGSNMVTRRPIELTLIHQDASKGRDRVEQVEYGEFPGLGLGRITDFKQIQKTLFDLNMAVPAQECVSDSPIELRIHSPHVPDLTMIDLPGYVQISSMDQPEELREKISKLCDRYIQEPNIILAVCSADVDLANSPALRASRRVDPLGLRTIGVITKMDLVPPEQGAALLSSNKYPLALGYVGVVCKKGIFSRFQSSAGHDRDSGQGKVTSDVMRQEDDYFSANREYFQAPSRGRNAGVEPMTGTDTLRRRLMSVLEESMGSSLHTISNAVQRELEEASYQFKVQYNDRSISAESYLAETMDTLKVHLKEFAQHFGKPEVRMLLKQNLDDKVMDVLAQLYWNDSNRSIEELSSNKVTKGDGEELDNYWQYKLEASSSAITKSGIGRNSTELVVSAIQKQLEHLISLEPFNYHAEACERILAFSTAILRNRFGLTSDQVENCIKPYKYEVEIDEREWENGRVRTVALVERELSMCQDAYNQLKKAIGSRRLNGAIEYINELEERDRRRKRNASASESNSVPDSEDPLRPDYNSALLLKAREAKFLQSRLDILKLRMAALKSKKCKASTEPNTKFICPEIFLNVVADKLVYTSTMFINIELLSEFFYQFKKELSPALLLSSAEGEEGGGGGVDTFAKENPRIKHHLELQRRKEILADAMEKLNALERIYDDSGRGRGNKHKSGSASSSGWKLFG
ncbi:unnamed protein product [Sympodiomycopsis kandeliae]